MPADSQPKTCTCGAPETYSLSWDEVIVHRTDGPCYSYTTSTLSDGA